MAGPQDPFNAMADTAIQMHTFFRTYVEAGFTEAQAMELIITMIRETLRHSLENP